MEDTEERQEIGRVVGRGKGMRREKKDLKHLSELYVWVQESAVHTHTQTHTHTHTHRDL